MKIAVLYPFEASKRGHWHEAHAEGCAHLKFRGAQVWVIEASSKEAAAEQIAADWLAEGCMTLADAVRDIHFAPCVKLADA